MMLAGRNCAVTPVGKPVTVSVMAALNVEFGVLVRVNVVDAPAATLREVTDDASVNRGNGATATGSDTVCFVDPLLATTVTEYKPGLALLVAVNLRTLLPDPGAEMLAGVNAAETPAGNPVIERDTAALNPPLTVTFMLMLLFDPAVTEREFADKAA